MLGRKSESRLTRKPILAAVSILGIVPTCFDTSTDSNNSTAAATSRNRYRSHGSLSDRTLLGRLSIRVSQAYGMCAFPIFVYILLTQRVVRRLRVIILRAQVHNSTPQFSVFFKPLGCAATSSDAETDLMPHVDDSADTPNSTAYSTSGVEAIGSGFIEDGGTKAESELQSLWYGK
ncbi:hypothetical protein B0H14DRAFT_2611153 [Mycena olivaceomarginata]|nr:hypothetical protein B0H14DRAFT_2611153 [Mycena olivaceomarginata]